MKHTSAVVCAAYFNYINLTGYSDY